MMLNRKQMVQGHQSKDSKQVKLLATQLTDKLLSEERSELLAAGKSDEEIAQVLNGLGPALYAFHEAQVSLEVKYQRGMVRLKQLLSRRYGETHTDALLAPLRENRELYDYTQLTQIVIGLERHFSTHPGVKESEIGDVLKALFEKHRFVLGAEYLPVLEEIRLAKAMLAEQDSLIAEKGSLISEKDAALAEERAKTAKLEALLRAQGQQVESQASGKQRGQVRQKREGDDAGPASGSGFFETVAPSAKRMKREKAATRHQERLAKRSDSSSPEGPH